MKESKLNISILLHDCHMEIGHAHAMMEVIRKSNDLYNSIEIISYTSSDPSVLLPDRPEIIKFIKVPFSNLRPSLVRSFFYHIWSLVYITFFQKKDTINISIGAASLKADLVNIQFVHAQWNDLFFETQELSFITKIYKKILFKYFLWAEKLLLSRKNIKLMVLAQFVSEFCLEHFSLDKSQVTTIYSGVNLEKFLFLNQTKEVLYNQLIQDYPSLKSINLDKPIFLFVGGYQRKGLPIALDRLSQNSNTQIIIIGRSESHRKLNIPPNINAATIDFTKELPKFYSLADAFIFPSIYEPFGLVLTEAAASGMLIFTNRYNIGASEILAGLDGVYFLEDNPSLNIPVLNIDKRKDIVNKRMTKLQEHNWINASEQFKKLLSSL